MSDYYPTKGGTSSSSQHDIAHTPERHKNKMEIDIDSDDIAIENGILYYSLEAEAKKDGKPLNILVNIDKNNGKIIVVEPKTEEEKQKVFRCLLNKTMYNFSEKRGIEARFLIICIAMSYKKNKNIRLFY